MLVSAQVAPVAPALVPALVLVLALALVQVAVPSPSPDPAWSTSLLVPPR